MLLPLCSASRPRLLSALTSKSSLQHPTFNAHMASLFRHFSFDPASRLPSPDPVLASVSPMSTSPLLLPARLPTPPPCSVGDLAQALHQQHLRIDTSFKALNAPLTPPSDDDASPCTLPEHLPSSSTNRLNSAALRMQRQANVRMQSSPSHIKDISSLVEKMIAVEDQCNVCHRKPRAPPSPKLSDDDDEGVNMDYTPSPKEELRYLLPMYRAADRVEGTTRVSKKPRMRKPTALRKIKILSK